MKYLLYALLSHLKYALTSPKFDNYNIFVNLLPLTTLPKARTSSINFNSIPCETPCTYKSYFDSLSLMLHMISMLKFGILFLGLYLTSMGTVSLGFNVNSLSGVNVT